jgi:hypothetical protein
MFFSYVDFRFSGVLCASCPTWSTLLLFDPFFTHRLAVFSTHFPHVLAPVSVEPCNVQPVSLVADVSPGRTWSWSRMCEVV